MVMCAVTWAVINASVVRTTNVSRGTERNGNVTTAAILKFTVNALTTKQVLNVRGTAYVTNGKTQTTITQRMRVTPM